MAICASYFATLIASLCREIPIPLYSGLENLVNVEASSLTSPPLTPAFFPFFLFHRQDSVYTSLPIKNRCHCCHAMLCAQDSIVVYRTWNQSTPEKHKTSQVHPTSRVASVIPTKCQESRLKKRPSPDYPSPTPFHKLLMKTPPCIFDTLKHTIHRPNCSPCRCET